MKLVTSKQMRELDLAAIERHEIPSLVLMERAGAAVAKKAAAFIKPGGAIAVIAGKGNNGGDGLVAARHLINGGFCVSVILLARSDEISPDARANLEFLAPLTAHIFSASNTAEFNSLRPKILGAGLIIDAIFGTGLDQEVKGMVASVIEFINAMKVPVISADIPSGLSADTGKVLGRAVRASATVTFGLPKLGLFIGDGPNYAGDAQVADIGIPEEEIARVESDIELIDPSMFAHYFSKRPPASHKGTYGRVAVFAGSLGHLGAGYLACLAALRSGAGLITYCLPEKAFARFDARYPEIMCDPIPDDGTAHFHSSGLDAALNIAGKKSAVVIGPAIGTEKSTREFVNSFVKKIALPLIIDADGLNVLDLNVIKTRRATTILTPHPGEMARLVGTTTDAIQADRLNYAMKLAKDSGAIIVLKGKGTVVAMPDGSACINPTGNAGMATAGMGDALTGIIASFVAQGMDAKTACTAAVYIHGLAGDMAAREHGERALITSDVITALGKAMKTVSLEA